MIFEEELKEFLYEIETIFLHQVEPLFSPILNLRRNFITDD